jgi:hypothetical protein
MLIYTSKFCKTIHESNCQKKLAPTKILVPTRCVTPSVIHVSSAHMLILQGLDLFESIACPITSLGPKNLFESLGTCM